MNVFKIYLKGNTIIEVLIALVITSFCAAMASVIYLNIQKSSLPFFKIKALELAELRMKQTLQEKSFYDDVYKNEEFTVKKNITAHYLLADCFTIRILVFDSDRKEICELESTYTK